MICLIDNYDSFTYNIVHYLCELEVDVKVILNDRMPANEILDMSPAGIVLSPGPGNPSESGVSLELLLLAAEHRIPVLGICLGHEIIGEVFGGSVRHAKRVMHGKCSNVYHNETGVFQKLRNGFPAARYHSLVVDYGSLPSSLEVNAWTCTDDGELDEIMGLSHASLPIHGVQFHPESVMTEQGHALLANFLDMCKDSANGDYKFLLRDNCVPS